MGIETEYGISVPGHPHVNSMMTSSQVVTAYGAAVTTPARLRARWDYDEESPLRDARGFDMSRAEADPSQLTDDDPGLANLILTNGARLYVDHAHPEYSSPEVTNPRDAVLWDKAGERIMARAVELVAQVPGSMPVNLYKNNTDNKGASYGTHENRKSHSGCTLHIGAGSGAFLSRSKKQTVTADSSTVAEFIATHLVCKEIMWARELLSELGYPQLEPTVLGEDNMSTIAMINNDCNGQKTKHIEIRFNLIREQVKLLKIALQHLPTQDMISDILTKPLDPKPFLHLRAKLLGMMILAE